MPKKILVALLFFMPLFSMEPDTNPSFTLNDEKFKDKTFHTLKDDIYKGRFQNIEHFFENYPTLIYTTDEKGHNFLYHAINSFVFGNSNSQYIVDYILRKKIPISEDIESYLAEPEDTRYSVGGKLRVENFLKQFDITSPSFVSRPISPSSSTQSSKKRGPKKIITDQTNKGHNDYLDLPLHDQPDLKPLPTKTKADQDPSEETETYFTASNVIKGLGIATIAGLLLYYVTKDQKDETEKQK